MDKPLIQRLGCLGLALLGIVIFLVIAVGAPSALIWLLVIAFAVSFFFLVVYETSAAGQQRREREETRRIREEQRRVREEQRRVREEQLAEEQQERAREQRVLERTIRSGNAVGDAFDGYVSGVVEHGAFVVFDFLHEFGGPGRVPEDSFPSGGFVQRSELSWRRSTEIDPGTVVTVGQTVRVLLMALEENRHGEPRFWVWGTDATTGYDRPFPRRYRLSIRRAAWPEAVDRYQVGQIVPAVVTEVQREFALLKLPGPVLGRANRTDVSGHHRHGGRMEDVIAEGDVVPVKVTFVNHAFFRLNVSYREARSETSEAGSWVFDQRGRVVQVPGEATETFPDECAAIETRYAARRVLSLRPPS